MTDPRPPFTLTVWDLHSARADLVGHFVGYEAAKRVYDHTATQRRQGEVVRLSDRDGTVSDESDL
jgi:hypothetical protein